MLRPVALVTLISLEGRRRTRRSPKF